MRTLYVHMFNEAAIWQLSQTAHLKTRGHIHVKLHNFYFILNNYTAIKIRDVNNPMTNIGGQNQE